MSNFLDNPWIMAIIGGILLVIFVLLMIFCPNIGGAEMPNITPN